MSRNTAAVLLDVDDIKFVINYDYPQCSEDYVHRIGRTGRCDKQGTAYTFFSYSNAKNARELIKILEEARQTIPPQLYEMQGMKGAMGNSRSRWGGGGGDRKRGYDGGRGGGGGAKRGRFDDGARNGFGGGGSWSGRGGGASSVGSMPGRW
uniref:Helicase C-terminal domain-containing protein n=1 Tax=Plectus sambesii TaxID=2011161 RepID=A0A914XQU8_9BILA